MTGIKPILGNGRRLAISDIHGCALTFEAVLNKINLEKADNLFILGDIINRGKRSKRVIKKIISLQKEGYHIFPLRGNHEHFIISEMHKKELQYFFEECERINMTWLFEDSEILRIKKKYLKFFSSLPFYYLMNDFILVHAGLDLTQKNFFDNNFAMIKQREFVDLHKIPQNMKIIHGHTPISLLKIKQLIDSNSPTINIDNGCVYKTDDLNKGNLVCLNLDTLQLTYHVNID